MRATRKITTVFATAAAGACLLVSAPGAVAAVECDTFAQTSGSPDAAGTYDDPFLTAQQALDAAGAGGTACLREGGTFDADSEIRVEQPNQTLTSAPGELAQLKGRIYVTKEADGSTVSDLYIDGRNDRMLALTINADSVTLSGNEITNHDTTICVIVGSPNPEWGRAHDTLIEDNRIHNCGSRPEVNTEHGIYVSAADRTTIRNNWIYDNADRGVQMYADADYTVITGNVIDGNGQGVIFGGDATTSDHNRVEHNVITNSRLRDNVESHWTDAGGPGEDNIATNNCVGGGAYDDGDGGIMQGAPDNKGFSAPNNLIVDDPGFIDRDGKNFELDPDSPCAEILAGAPAVDDPDPDVDPDPKDDPQVEPGDGGSVKRLVLRVNRHRVSSGSRFKIRGRSPKHGKVKIEVKRRHGWKRIARTDVGRSGRFQTRVRADHKGKVKLRASAPGAGKSKPVKVKVRR